MEEILILTGESRTYSDVKYIGEAVKIARKYFKNIGIEIYPVNVDEYQYLHECGVDYVTVFQETYNTDKYETLHLMGHKRVWPYRFDAQAVSYTHLDVYKRQDLCRRTLGEKSIKRQSTQQNFYFQRRST